MNTIYRTKTELSKARQQLIELLQRINFGKIENLSVVDGEPILDPFPRVVETRKLGAEIGTRPEAELRDFSLKRQVIDLFLTMDEMGDGILSVVVKHGLPFLVEVERAKRR